jgi:membrane-bound lytic murein transglycosylase D
MLESDEGRSDPTDLWDRIRGRLDLLLWTTHKAVKSGRNWSGLQQAYLDEITERARPYLHHIVEEIERRNLPAELALLPIIESAFDTSALSQHHAAGIWQLIPSTGRRFGLKQDAWYDGRKDVLASTAAALDYLELLRDRFGGNWLHAIAAYNCGEGLVESAIDRNRALGRPTEFWSLDLPAETKGFVPRLLAVSSIIANPSEYNVSLKPIPNRPYIARVQVQGQVGLDQVAQLADLSLSELRSLNPGYISSSTAPNGAHKLVVPVSKAKKLRQRLAQLPPEQRKLARVEPLLHEEGIAKLTVANPSSTRQHPGGRTGAQSKSLWGGIAHLRPEDFLHRREDLTAGMSLFVPDHGKQDNTAVNDNSSLNGYNSARYVSYRIKEGDSLWLISQRFRVTVEQLRHWNVSLRSDAGLQPGSILHIYANHASHA